MIILECEFVGYLSSPYTVEWFDDLGNIIAPDDKYNITTEHNGSNTVVLSGESEPRKSIISTLTITSLTDDDEANYTCIMTGNTDLYKTIKLIFEGI